MEPREVDPVDPAVAMVLNEVDDVDDVDVEVSVDRGVAGDAQAAASKATGDRRRVTPI